MLFRNSISFSAWVTDLEQHNFHTTTNSSLTNIAVFM